MLIHTARSAISWQPLPCARFSAQHPLCVSYVPARPFLDRLWAEYAASTSSGKPKVSDAAVLLSAGDAPMTDRVASVLGLAREQAGRRFRSTTVAFPQLIF